jgi:cell division inhibitor SepF
VGFIERARNAILGSDLGEEENIIEEVVEEIEDIPEKIRIKRRGKPDEKDNSKIVNIHPAVKFEVVRSSPETIDDARDVSDHIREGKICVINLEGVEMKDCQRIVDFLAGSVYALAGDIQRVTKRVFIIAPTTVEITGQLKEELRETGFFFPWLKKDFTR